MIIGLQIVLGLELNKKEQYSDIAVVPMATPLIAGPGTITTLIILVGIYGYLAPFIALVLNLIVNFLMLNYSENLIHVIGKQGSEVISKITGMILVALSIEFVISGITMLFN